MRRYERQELTYTHLVEVEARCDRCGVSKDDTELRWLCHVEIEVDERRDEYDFCDPCLTAMAAILSAAGSRSTLVQESNKE